MRAGCPECGNPTLWYSSYRTIHFIRMISGSPKRYCPNCGNLWKLRSHALFSRSQIISVLLMGVVVYYGFHFFEVMGQKAKQAESGLRQSMMEKAKTEFKARYGTKDLQSLSPEEKKALKEQAHSFFSQSK